MIIREGNIDTTGTIFSKALQILEYADDLDIIAGDMRYFITAVDSVVGVADDVVLEMNISKTKYMFSTSNKSQRQQIHIYLPTTT